MKKFLKKYVTKRVIGIILVCLVFVVVAFGLGKKFSTESKTNTLGFQDIGELVTQVAFGSEVSVTDVSRDLYGIEIPFTNSKMIFSYDVVIKAGFDFEKIEYHQSEHVIKVKMPSPYIISCEVDQDSFKVYHEQESIFRRVTLDETNTAVDNLKIQAKKDAIDNGLYDNAKANAEILLKAFFSQNYDLNKYSIEFDYENEG